MLRAFSRGDGVYRLDLAVPIMPRVLIAGPFFDKTCQLARYYRDSPPTCSAIGTRGQPWER